MRARSWFLLGGAATTLLVMSMMSVGNAPFDSTQPSACAPGAACAPASLTTGIVDAGTVVVASGNNLCLDGPTCSVAIMNNTGQMVFSAPVAGGRFPGTLTAQGTTTLGSAFADYITIAGASAGNGATITAVSSGANSPVNVVPKGTANFTVSTGVTATGAASSFAAGTTIATRLPVLDNNGGNQQVCLWGTKAMSGGSGSITFGTAFGASPICTCTHVNTTNANACNISSAGTPSTTAVTFAVTSGGTDVIHWMCCGDK